MNRNNPMVSVSLICYNQEKYIEECLNSIITQKTSFPFEIIVGDDCSTDNTLSIINKIAKDHENIVVLKRAKNLGLQRNIVDVISHCSGKYIALLEGDDFWIDENKLQKQYEVLENNIEVAVVFTDAIVFHDNDINSGVNFQSKKKTLPNCFDVHYFLSNAVSIANNTRMFRKDSLPNEYPDFFYSCIQWDWTLSIIQGLNGNYMYLDVPTLAYRRHSNTLLHERNLEKNLRDGIRLINAMRDYFQDDLKKYFNKPLYQMNELAFYFLRKKKLVRYLYWHMKWFLSIPKKDINLRDEFYKFRVNIRNNN